MWKLHDCTFSFEGCDETNALTDALLPFIKIKLTKFFEKALDANHAMTKQYSLEEFDNSQRQTLICHSPQTIILYSNRVYRNTVYRKI